MRRTLALAALLLSLAFIVPARAATWIYDQNASRIDDRIEATQTHGLAWAFEDHDVTKRALIGVFAGVPLAYAIYVGYDHAPTAADASALSTLGLAVVHPYHSINYIRAQATFTQIQAITALPGVTRIESIPMFYADNHYGSRVLRARDSRGLAASQNYVLFPSARQELGLDGRGVVIGILDTGVNDAPDSVVASYPGHESVVGKFLGGGNFYAGNPLLNTASNQSLDPSDHGGTGSEYHATHVAGTAMGTGGPGGFFAGVAPAARLVDCKVLSDAGAGFGASDGVQWCIDNRNTVWPGTAGTPDTIYRGVQVLNMSLGCLQCTSDGTSADEAMVNAAVDAGITVCIASGNDGNVNGISDPAGAAKCIAVGASDHHLTLGRSDDTVTDFSNEGPRTDDGDSDKSDEMKPSIVAPGAGIVSANGDPTTDGTSYKVLNGTSMATPHAVGCVALIKQANPALTPLEIRAILQNTAEHNITSVKGVRPNDPFGVDANYNPGCGWGLIDVYAAAKEALNSSTGVQVTQFRPVPRPPDGAIDVRWITQREFPFLGFDVYRAPDVGGAPGGFTRINLAQVAPAGHSNIQGASNRTPYLFTDSDPSLTIGQTYWYRVAWVDGGSVSHFEPPAPALFGARPALATAYYSLTHNAVGNDLFIRVGTSFKYDTHHPDFFRTGLPESAEDSTAVLVSPGNPASSTIGNVQHFWSMRFASGDGAEIELPPSPFHPWFLNVAEGGYLNRNGRVNSFSVFVNDTPGSPTGTTYVTDSNTPQQTTEGQETTLWIPAQGTLAVEFAAVSAAPEAGGVRITVTLRNPESGALARVYRSERDDFDSRVLATADPIRISGSSFSWLDPQATDQSTTFYWIEVRRGDGSTVWNGPVSATAIRFTRLEVPGPNPARSTASMSYAIGSDAAGTGPARVTVTVHDVQGRLVRRIAEGPRPVGRYRVTWNLEDESHTRVPGGVYFVSLEAGLRREMARVVVVR